MANLLVVFYDVSQVVSAAVVRLSHAHGVVREVDIAVIAKELGHLEWFSWPADLAASSWSIG